MPVGPVSTILVSLFRGGPVTALKSIQVKEAGTVQLRGVVGQNLAASMPRKYDLGDPRVDEKLSDCQWGEWGNQKPSEKSK